jgi:membrane protein DedA with SNARE-associated domain
LKALDRVVRRERAGSAASTASLHWSSGAAPVARPLRRRSRSRPPWRSSLSVTILPKKRTAILPGVWYHFSRVNEIIALITRHGAAVVFVVAFLEQIGAPVPAIPVIIVAAGIAWVSGGSIPFLFFLAIAGALLADVIWYLLGRRYGYRVLALLCRISLSPDSCVRKTESMFERFGLLSLVFSKFLPGFSLVAPPLAGAVARLRFITFFITDAIGAALWAGAAILAGIVFHDSIDRVVEQISEHGRTATVIALALLALIIGLKWWERRRFYRTLRMARISAEELRDQLRGGSRLVVLDVRSRYEQKNQPHRIPGAILVDAGDIGDALRDIAPHQEIVLYCT